MCLLCRIQVLVNAADNVVSFVIPQDLPATDWSVVVDTNAAVVNPIDPGVYPATSTLKVGSRSILILQAVPDHV